MAKVYLFDKDEHDISVKESVRGADAMDSLLLSAGVMLLNPRSEQICSAYRVTQVKSTASS